MKVFLLAISYINILNKKINKNVLFDIVETHGPIPNLLLPPIQVIKEIIIPNPWWINGFIVGEGSFTFFKRTRVTISDKLKKIDFTLVFEISQRTNDSYLLNAILAYFGTGNIFNDKKGISRCRFSALPILQHIILPYFKFFPLTGFKKKQYDIWLKGVFILITQTNRSEKRQMELINITNQLSNLNYKK